MSKSTRAWKLECKECNIANIYRQEYGAINPYKIIPRKEMSTKYCKKLKKDDTKFFRYFLSIFKEFK